MLKVIFLMTLLFSGCSFANQSFNVFVKREFNATDFMVGFGATASMASTNSLLKGEFISSFNYVEVFDKEGTVHNFASLDTGVRLGLYGQFFIYIEAGFDAFEMILKDTRDEDNFYDLQQNNQVDGYAGLGVGIDVSNIRIEGFVKARQIDGDTWDNNKKIFYGLQLSLFF